MSFIHPIILACCGFYSFGLEILGPHFSSSYSQISPCLKEGVTDWQTWAISGQKKNISDPSACRNSMKNKTLNRTRHLLS